MAVRNRIENLERAIAPESKPQGCSTCGAGMPGEPDYKVIFEGDEEPSGPEVCPDCGTRLVYSLSFEDLADDAGEQL